MKPISSLSNGGTKSKPRYSVHFDDGITLIINTESNQLVYESMLSTGLDSYYIKKKKWPAGKNLKDRVEMAIAFINKNKKNNRYKKREDDDTKE